MSKKYVIFIFAGALLYVIYHIVTLVYSPIPWFDEATYADITESFMKNGHFYEAGRNITWATSKLDLAYGPVYFMLQAAVTKIFGFSIFTFRITNMFFGLANLFLLYKVCRQLKFNDHIILITMLLVCFDPQFNQFLNSGRMDFVALFFFLSSYLVFTGIKNDGTNKYVLKGLLTGLLMACAFLTNPRILFSFSFYICFFFYELSEHKFKNIKQILLKNTAVAIAFIFIYSIWIYIEFGSLGNYISETYTNSPIMKEHVGITSVGLKLSYNLLMHIISVLCFLILVVYRKVKENINVILFTVPGIIVFLFMVSGGIAGRYYGLIVPFTTIIIVGATVNVFNNLFVRVFTRSLICLFIAFFIFKATYIFASMDQRNPVYYDKVIASTIPMHASVAADFEYYYIVKKHNWTYQCLEQNGTLDEKIVYYQNHKYDYFIINKNNELRSIYEKTFLKDRYQLIATIDDNNYNNFTHSIIVKSPYKISEGYACYIYKYIGK